MTSQYDAFEHLRRALFWEEDKPIAMLTFYADDAGHKDSDNYVVIAGYVGLVAQWERFCSDWRLQLAAKGLPEFHASDFFTGNGIYKGWDSKERQHDKEELLTGLAQIVRDYSLASFSCFIDVHGWFRANDEYLLDEVGFSPFPLGGRTVVERVRTWCAESGFDPSRVEYIFDQGSHDWGKLQTRLRADFDIEPIERNRRKIRPLQAADWIAYEGFKEIPQSEGPRRIRKIRDSYLALLKVPSDPIIYRPSDFITQLCSVPKMKIPRRSEQGKAAVRLTGC